MADQAVAAGPLRPAFALLGNALVWGLSWWPFRALQSEGLHPLWSTVGVYLLSLTALLALRPGALAAFFGSGRLGGLLALVLASGLTNVGFNWAVTEGDVVRVVLLFYLMPAWSILMAWPLLGERPTPVALARLALALGGVFIVLDTSGAGLPLPQTLAEGLALMGGACFALTNILLRRLEAVSPSARIMAMFAGGAVMAALTGGLGMLQGSIPAPAITLAGVPVALLLGVAFLLGNVALQYGATRLPAQATALIMLSEVVFASVSSIALGAAELSGRTLFGGALILAAAAWAAWPSSRNRQTGAPASAP